MDFARFVRLQGAFDSVVGLIEGIGLKQQFRSGSTLTKQGHERDADRDDRDEYRQCLTQRVVQTDV